MTAKLPRFARLRALTASCFLIASITVHCTDSGTSSSSAGPRDASTAIEDDRLRACEGYLSAFTNQRGLVTATCDGDTLQIVSANGLPDPAPADPLDRAMVGVTSWIQRVPIPFALDWRIPSTPSFLSEYQQTTGIGPNAVAINGVPIFHYEARPEVNIDPTTYDPRSDTVRQGELDQCGGHAGQGEDYHYHYPPVCLLGEHDLSEPIAFGLDGIPIYFGTGGDDYYGRGRYSDVNNLPNQSSDSLDLCNAYRLEDGRYVYYTTAEPPYMIGCHRADFDRQRQINIPFSGRQQGSPVPFGTEAGEPFATNILDWFEDELGYHLRFARDDGSTGEVIYRQTDTVRDCWSFEFKSNTTDTSGVVEEYCR